MLLACTVLCSHYFPACCQRSILKRTEEPFWHILHHYHGTVLPAILSDTLFWITLIIYIGVRVWARTGLPDYVADLGSGDIAIIGGFLSFFLVFYVNQSNKRYFMLYGAYEYTIATRRTVEWESFTLEKRLLVETVVSPFSHPFALPSHSSLDTLSHSNSFT